MNAFVKGQKDFRSGTIENPFNEGTHRYKEWERGFNSAYFENLEKVKKVEKARDQLGGRSETV